MPLWRGLDTALPRANLATDSLAVFGLAQSGWRSPSMAALGNSSTADTFFMQGTGSNQWYFRAEDAKGNTKTDVMWLAYVLPPEYVAGGSIKIRVVTGLAGGGTAGTCTVACSVYKQANDASVGADLVTTVATAISAAYGAKDFTVTPTGLTAGNRLNIKITAAVQETGAATTLVALITDVAILLDIKG